VCEECRGAQALADLCQQPGRENEGQKRIRRFGKVEIPQSAFFAALKMGDG
jgi:translation elongation factor EF-4